MYEDNQDEIERLKQLLEQVRLQDQILEEIETKLHQMKIIARYAVNHELSHHARAQLNIKIQDRKTAIKELERQLAFIH